MRLEFTNDEVSLIAKVGRKEQVLAKADLTAFVQGCFDYLRPGEFAQLNGMHLNANERDIIDPAVRWLSRDGTCFVFEHPPRQKMVHYKTKDTVGLKSTIISLPWQVLFGDIKTGRVMAFSRPGPITSMSDQLFLMPFPNISPTGIVEWDEATAARIKEKIAVPSNSMMAHGKYLIDQFWDLTFTDSVSPAVPESLGKTAKEIFNTLASLRPNETCEIELISPRKDGFTLQDLIDKQKPEYDFKNKPDVFLVEIIKRANRITKHRQGPERKKRSRTKASDRVTGETRCANCRCRYGNHSQGMQGPCQACRKCAHFVMPEPDPFLKAQLKLEELLETSELMELLKNPAAQPVYTPLERVRPSDESIHPWAPRITFQRGAGGSNQYYTIDTSTVTFSTFASNVPAGEDVFAKVFKGMVVQDWPIESQAKKAEDDVVSVEGNKDEEEEEYIPEVVDDGDDEVEYPDCEAEAKKIVAGDEAIKYQPFEYKTFGDLF